MVADSREVPSVDAVVVGAGFAGLYMLYKLRDELGLRTRVIEAAAGVGGTWFWNKYPGARCDTESVSYSYSFSPELEQQWTWTERFPTQPEILRYLNHVADRFHLRDDITFNTRVTGARYESRSKRWVVRTDAGETIVAQFLVTATGCSSALKLPEIPGIDTFRGGAYHTGHWPDDGVDFTNQRVALIGTGCSAVQSIPLIAQQASELVVFQRTPTFSVPANNRVLTRDDVARMKANYTTWRDAQRHSNFGIPHEDPPTQSALEVTDPERRARYEVCWAKGGITDMMTAYTDLLTNQAANDTAADFVRDKIRSIVTDIDTTATLASQRYPFAAKRATVDTDYYTTFNSPHVHLVDLRKTPLVEITPKGIRTSETEREFDAIVYATGYDSVTGALTQIDIRGTGSVGLREKWASGVRTYLGVAVAGFPNLFTITGPLSPSVLSNMVVSIEQHVEWIGGCMAWLRKEGVEEIEATVEAEDAWVAHASAVAACTLFSSTSSLYTGANVPGKARKLLPYIGGVAAYRKKCDEVAANGYEGFRLTKT